MSKALDDSLGSSLLTRVVASSRFEAARELHGMLPGNKLGRLHGHGFLVSAHVHQPSNLSRVAGGVGATTAIDQPWPPYTGGELPALLAEVQRHSDSLNYSALNDVVSSPSDMNLAHWFASQVAVPGLAAVALQSTPEQGVIVAAKQGTVGIDQAVVWRRYRFQAAHQLPNVPVGHKCGRLHGHGFEVVLYCTMAPDTADGEPGWVDYDALDNAWAQVSDRLQHRCLNDIDGLENPTSEMLAAWLWQRLKGPRPLLSSLIAVSVYETASCGATFDGQAYRIWKDFTIDSAVRYRHADAVDPRARVHGYTYTLRLSLSAPLDQVMGWTVDFGDVKEVFNPVFKALDHHPLHENAELAALSSGDTASMARWLFLKTQELLPSIVQVDLFETEGCGSSVGTDLRGPVLPLIRL